MAAAIHPNLLPPDRRATFQICSHSIALQLPLLSLPGIRAAMPFSKRWITRNTGREFNERASIRTTDSTSRPALTQLMRNFPRE